MEGVYIAVINGPNLNKLGKRATDIYGEEPFEVTLEQLKKIAGNKFRIEYSQSNSEGEIIDLLQKHGDRCNSRCAGIILNPGAYAHYSYAIADAIRDVSHDCPVIEVHISNIFSRETFREKSVTAEATDGFISGLGRDGYKVALNYVMNLYLNNSKGEETHPLPDYLPYEDDADCTRIIKNKPFKGTISCGNS